MKICLDAGHGGNDPGAVFQSLREKDITLAIVLQLERLMKAEGRHTPLMTRVKDHAMLLGERVRLANAEDCDVFLSVHCNADPDDDSPGTTEASGAEVWVHEGSKRSYHLAAGIHKGFSEFFPGFPWRGIRKTKNLYVLKHTAMPAALVEVGFIDSRHDAEFLSRPGIQVRIAALLLEALDAFSELPSSAFVP